LVALGTGALTVALWNFWRETATIGLNLGPIAAAAIGVALSSGVLYAGYRLAESDLDDEDAWRVTLVAFAGGVFTASAYLVTVVIRVVEGRPLVEPLFPLVVVGTLGVLGGVVIGWERVLTKQYATSVKESRDAMAFTNSLLRHDVRNGLQIIGGRSAYLASHEDESVRESAAVIDGQVESLDQLIAQVQSVTDVLTGDLEPETVDLSAILHDVLDAAADGFSRATIERDLPDELPVEGAEALYSVFDNLVENAVEHADTDDVHVRVTGECEGDCVCITVADNGQGVKAGDREQIFEQGVSRDGGGHGLYVADTIVDRLDGTIRVTESDLGGAAFVVELPAADPTNEDDDPFSA
jgi:signal transduction histidine kinase